MQSSKEQQEEIRKPFSAQNGKDQRTLQENQRYQGNISCKDGLNKGQKWYGPTQEYTEELCKKDLHDPDNHDGVITHLKPDILEWEVKWDLGSIIMNKPNEVMEFQLS